MTVTLPETTNDSTFISYDNGPWEPLPKFVKYNTTYVVATPKPLPPEARMLTETEAEAKREWAEMQTEGLSDATNFGKIGFAYLPSDDSVVDRFMADPVNVANVRTILKGAEDVLRTKGWCKGTLCDTDGRVCLVGAMLTAAHETDTVSAVMPALRMTDRTIVANGWNGSESLGLSVSWNDSMAMSVMQVLGVLEGALALADTF